MPQTSITRQGKAKPPAYWETIRDRIDAAKAVEVLNDVIRGKKVPEQQARYSFATINKLLPSMQAVAVQVEHKVAASWADIQAKALESGIDPLSLVPGKQLIPKEKTIEHQDDSEGGLPPDTQP